MLTQKFLVDAFNTETIFLEPLPFFDEKNLKKKWVYKVTNLLPSSIPAVNATSCLPFVVEKNREIVVRDKATGKVVVAVYRNRIGPDALKLMQETVLEMFQLRRQVARPDGISKLNQGSLTAAGYFIILKYF